MTKEIVQRIISTIILVPVTLFFIIKGSYYFIFFLSICFLISCYEWHTLSKNKIYFVPGFVFLLFSFCSSYALRNGGDEFETIFFITLLICVSTDIGGYTFGKIIKGPKLTKISPNKTLAGVFGSFIISIILVYLLFKHSNLMNVNLFYFFDNNTTFLLTLIILISSVSQVGDIIISFFKRISKFKNTGKLIPGHGGLLDRIDGMIFAFPFSYLMSLILI